MKLRTFLFTLALCCGLTGLVQAKSKPVYRANTHKTVKYKARKFKRAHAKSKFKGTKYQRKVRKHG